MSHFIPQTVHAGDQIQAFLMCRGATPPRGQRRREPPRPGHGWAGPCSRPALVGREVARARAGGQRPPSHERLPAAAAGSQLATIRRFRGPAGRAGLHVSRGLGRAAVTGGPASRPNPRAEPVGVDAPADTAAAVPAAAAAAAGDAATGGAAGGLVVAGPAAADAADAAAAARAGPSASIRIGAPVPGSPGWRVPDPAAVAAAAVAAAAVAAAAVAAAAGVHSADLQCNARPVDAAAVGAAAAVAAEGTAPPRGCAAAGCGGHRAARRHSHRAVRGGAVGRARAELIAGDERAGAPRRRLRPAPFRVRRALQCRVAHAAARGA
eukprot:1932224-Prymnesium_polylepis.1